MFISLLLTNMNITLQVQNSSQTMNISYSHNNKKQKDIHLSRTRHKYENSEWMNATLFKTPLIFADPIFQFWILKYQNTILKLTEQFVFSLDNRRITLAFRNQTSQLSIFVLCCCCCYGSVDVVRCGVGGCCCVPETDVKGRCFAVGCKVFSSFQPVDQPCMTSV